MNKKTNILVECALLIAIGTVLSFIPIGPELPLGGKITPLSMLPVCLAGLRHGPKWGFGTAFVYSVLQMLISVAEVVSWGLTPVSLIACLLLDYILAYTVLGIAGLFSGSKTVGLCLGVICSIAARFVCHLITGAVIFDIWLPEGWNNAWFYSLCYNGGYLLPEMILTTVAVIVLASVPATKKLLIQK